MVQVHLGGRWDLQWLRGGGVAAAAAVAGGDDELRLADLLLARAPGGPGGSLPTQQGLRNGAWKNGRLPFLEIFILFGWSKLLQWFQSESWDLLGGI